DGYVTRIDPSSQRLVDSVKVADSASSIALSSDAIWVADRTGAIVRLNPSDLSLSPSRIPVTSSPEALAVSGSDVWVATRASVESHRGGTLRVSNSDLPELDPLAFPYFNVAFLEADGLVGYRHVGGVLGSTLLPDLATSLPQPTNGGLTYTFQLRPDLVY